MATKQPTQYIDAAQIEALLLTTGMSLVAQAGFVKVAPAGSPAHGPKIYVARSKRVGRIDLSGFTVEDEGVVTLDDDLRFGNVAQQVDFTRPAEDTLKTLKAVLKALAKAPVPERAPRKAPKAKASEAKGWQTIASPAPKADRLAAIKEAAEKATKKPAGKGKKAPKEAAPEAQADVTETPIHEEAVNETPSESIPVASLTLG